MRSSLIGVVFIFVLNTTFCAVNAMDWVVTAVPDEMELPGFYRKYVNVDGYPIVSSERVRDEALLEAAFLIHHILKERPDVKAAMIASGSRMVVMAHDEYTTDLPEQQHMKPKNYWDARARGLGGSVRDPLCSCGEENLLGFEGDPYGKECILIHEFAHNIHLRGMTKVDPTFDVRVKQAYETAILKGLWSQTYASTNHCEYFAEGVQSWFNNNRQNDREHNHVNTRQELLEYDPALAALCHEVFGETEFEYTKPTTRLTGHLLNYDAAGAPSFEWPEHLKAEREKITENVDKRNAEAD